MHLFLVTKRVLFGSGILLNTFILLSCLIAWSSAILFRDYDKGVPHFIIVILWFGLGVLGLFLTKRFFKSRQRIEIPGLLWLILASVLSCIFALEYGVPFENDFYRYFFEGKALSLGLNPYLYSPSELAQQVSFSHYFSIGYPELSAVYPPLTLFLFSFFGELSFPTALFLFSSLNSLFVWWFLMTLSKRGVIGLESKVVLLVFLIREMLFQHHFEMWPILFFTFGLLEKSWSKRMIYFFLSFHLKLLGLIPLIFNCFKATFIDKRLFSLIVTSLGILISFLFLNRVHFFESRGLLAFSEDWYFSPGFLGWLWPLVRESFEFSTVKLFSLLTFCLYGGALSFKMRRGVFNSKGLCLVMVAFFYFSPVYNSWYALWPALLMFKEERVGLGIWALILSPLCYTYFLVGTTGEVSWLTLGVSHFLVHWPSLVFLTTPFVFHLGSNHKRANQSANL